MSVQARKAYKERGGTAPLIVSLCNRWRWSGRWVERTAWPDVWKQTFSCPLSGI